MIKIDIDIPDLDELMIRLQLLREQLDEDGLKQYLDLLMGDGDVSVSATLQANIYDMVYNSPVEMIAGNNYKVNTEPTHYQRTGALLDAVRAEVKGNNLHLYIDDNYLAGQESPGTLETGTATNMNETPYSLRVENDFVYENAQGVDVLRKGSKYMQKTYEELKLQIMQGRKNPKTILMPLLGMWKN
jgi:hypothetical protein